MSELFSVVNIERFTTEIKSLPIENDIREELISCIQSIQIIKGLNLSDVSNSDEKNNHLSRYNDVIILLNKIAEVGVVVLEVCKELPFHFGTICKVITMTVGFVFSKDIASVVINRFTAIIEADLIAKCRATCTKMAHCITYMQGLPSVDGLQPSEKLHHLQLLASDVPIQTGLDELLFLGEKIKQMVDAANVKKANKLFEHAQLYCCLATTRELFLLYRFAIQSAFSNEASSIRNILSAQKTNYSCVLRFLYKPTVGSVRLFCCLFLRDWLILRHFLDRHRLVTDDLSELSGRCFRMRTLRGFNKFYQGFFKELNEKLMSLSGLDCEDRTIFEFRAVANKQNFFTIWWHFYQPPRQIYCNIRNNLRVKDEGENVSTTDNALWYILRVHPETPEESICYMIWLGTDLKRCLQFSWFTCSIDTTSSTDPSNDKLWTLESTE